jgi:hypothetical protein
MSDCRVGRGVVLLGASGNRRLDCPDCCLHPAACHPIELLPDAGEHRCCRVGTRLVVLVLLVVMLLRVVWDDVNDDRITTWVCNTGWDIDGLVEHLGSICEDLEVHRSTGNELSDADAEGITCHDRLGATVSSVIHLDGEHDRLRSTRVCRKQDESKALTATAMDVLHAGGTTR